MIAVDLFCGAGGAARGLHEAGFAVPFGVDRDEAALRSYNESLPGDPIQHDLRALRPDVVPPLEIDLLHGSPPCQGFSQARGERDPADERNLLVWRFLEWVEHLRPRAVTMENVPGMATISSTFMDRVIGGFRDRGYRARWRTLNAADYGVPQTRERIFVVGLRRDLSVPSRWFPRPTHAKAGTTTFDGRRLRPWRTVREAIGDLYLATDGGAVMTSQQNEGHQAAGRRDLHPVDEPAKTLRGGTPPLVLPNHVEQDHRPETRAKFARIPRGGMGNGQSTRRLAPDRPSPTITADEGSAVPPIHYGPLPNHEPVEHSDEAREKWARYVPGETYGSVTESRLAGDEPSRTICASRSTPPIVGPDITDDSAPGADSSSGSIDRGQPDPRIRRLTVREAARLQSFPDTHYFVGTKTEQLQQVGNAVPPMLMRHLAGHVRKLLENPEVGTAGG